ncbi:MAG: cytidylate kinase family protein [Candidatus Rokubacteria bacterium]|nr:cytidylate kinase family protein [Candidatus Rokubacteria bacterium]
MSIVAVTREMGSLGTSVGMAVAQRLGYVCVREDITREAAEEYQVPEPRLVEVIEEYPGLFERLTRSARRYHAFVAAEVLDAAVKERVVIIGRWSTFLLAGIAHAVRVRVTAPLDIRVDRIAERLRVDRDEALGRVQAYDRGVRARIRQLFHVEWSDPLNYDLTITTDRIGIDTGTAQILALAAAPEFQPTDDSRRQLRDRALAARVRAALKAKRATARVDVEVRVDGARVTLAGTVETDAERDAAMQVVRGVDGVETVTSGLRVTEPPPR